MVSNGNTSLDSAIAAQEALIMRFGLDRLLGRTSGSTTNFHMMRSIGISADPPTFEDHFIKISLPTGCDISDIPRAIDGVRVVVELMDQPGPIAYHPRKADE